MKKIRGLLVVAIMCFIAMGCASSRSGQVYSRDQARKTQTVRMGTVELVKDVQIEGTKSGLGVIAGGVAGGAVGSTVGGGSGKTVATVLGAIAGGVAGSAVEEGVTRKQGLEITVKMDSGESLVVVQEADEEFFEGDRVRVLKGSDGITRVRH